MALKRVEDVFHYIKSNIIFNIGMILFFFIFSKHFINKYYKKISPHILIIIIFSRKKFTIYNEFSLHPYIELTMVNKKYTVIKIIDKINKQLY